MSAAENNVPPTMPWNFDAIPTELKLLQQWVGWKWSISDKGKKTKVPINVKTLGNASHSNPQTWESFARAIAAYNLGHVDGIGFVFTRNDDYVGIDQDNAVSSDGEITDRAAACGSYTEYSPSGRGLHTIVYGKLPVDESGRKNKQIEIYQHSRFFTFTGEIVPGSSSTITENPDALKALWEQSFPEPKAALHNATPPDDSQFNDDVVIERARAARNGAKFDALWSGDISAYGSHSEAELALCSLLAFWTQDANQIDRLVRRSGLYREKWDRQDYSERTINRALERSEYYTGRGSFRVVEGGRGNTSEPPPPDEKPAEPAAAPPDFPLTDTGNAERLVHRHGHDVKYNYSRGVWHVWTGSHWGEDTAGQMDQLAKDTVRSIPQEAAGLEGEAYTRRLKFAASSESAGKRAAMIELARSEPGIPVLADALDANPWLLNVANGTLDLLTGNLQPHDRADLITRCLRTPYDRAAACPTFLGFLDRVFAGNTELVSYVQRMIGYALTGSIREQAIFIAYGNGSNGKSTLLGAIANMLEQYATEADTDSFLERQGDRIREDVAALDGARFVSASETADGKRLSEAFVKKATGGEKLRARRLFENGYTFMPTCKVWLSTNHRPQIAGTDLAIWRRIRLIPFMVTIPDNERDRDLPAKLEAELPGILTWAVEGCKQWLSMGEQPSTAVMQATAQYRRDSDALANWLEDRCELKAGAREQARELYSDYLGYCDRSGEEALKQRTFGTRLTERGFGETRTGAARFRTGIRLINPERPNQASFDGES
ncbi:MAG: phage/plasmid primase, P4 family [Thermomicrobiales bacterium]